MHVINFTKLPPFSACNIENTREPGNEAINLTLSMGYTMSCRISYSYLFRGGGEVGGGGWGRQQCMVREMYERTLVLLLTYIGYINPLESKTEHGEMT